VTVLGVGGTTVVGPGSFNFWPLLFMPLALLTIRFVLGFPLRAPSCVAALVAGTALGWSVGSWGLVQPLAVAVLVVGLARLRRAHRWPA
jgi:hypothetical protein